MLQSKTKTRINILKYVALFLFAIILVRLFFIQIIEHGDWVAKAEEQHKDEITIVPRRGEIYMMDHDEPVQVVLNQSLYRITIDPTVTPKENAEKVIKEYVSDYVVPGLNIDDEYEKVGSKYALLAKNIPPELADKIKEANLIGIFIERTNHRFYSEGELASSLLGFVNADGKGQYGVEGSLNSVLAGKEGKLKATFSASRVALSVGDDNVKIPAEDGKDIVLSVDRGLEKGIEELAAEAINNTIATNAAVLVMDPNTSKVLAMVDLPNYNPANYDKVTDASIFLNNTLEVPYEPASVCKTFTYATAINEGVMTPDTTYFNSHVEYIDGWPINNASKYDWLYGTMDMRSAYYHSLNTGSIYALKLLGGDTNSINQQGREKLFDYFYNRFRFGQHTGIEIYEADGLIQDPNEGWGRDSTYANMTFGQNLNVTMLQTATAFSAVVNGGAYRTPSIIEGYYENQEIIPMENEDKIEDKILSDETSATMRELLTNNRRNFVSRGIDRSGYSIGGKTGTGQVVRDGSYDDTFSELIGSYLGFVGQSGELPKYVILVKMWGEGQGVGSDEATSLFNATSNFIIDYFKLKPKE